MARKVLFRQTGSADVLRIEEIVTPVPAAGEVRIRVRAISINRSEVNLRAGTYGQRQPSRCNVPSVLENDAKLASMKKYFIDGLESEAFRIKIAKTFSFDKIAEAHRYLESNDQLGKVVITI